jgi:hypothetical protein
MSQRVYLSGPALPLEQALEQALEVLHRSGLRGHVGVEHRWTGTGTDGHDAGRPRRRVCDDMCDARSFCRVQ